MPDLDTAASCSTVRIGHRAWDEQLRPLRERNACLARAIARPEFLQAHDESVPGVGRDDVELVRGADHDSFEGRAVGGIDAPGEGLALAAGGSEGMRRDAVHAAGGVEKHRRLVAAAPGHRPVSVTGAIAQAPRLDLVPLRGADPASFGEHHGDRLARREVRLSERLRRVTLDERRAALVAVALGIGQQLVADQHLQPSLALEDLREPAALGRELRLLGPDLHLLQAREIAQPQVEDRLGLHVGEPEPAHERLPRALFFPDDRDDLVDVEERDEQALQDVQPVVDLIEAMLGPAAHRRDAKLQPLGEDRFQIRLSRAVVEPHHGHVDPVAPLQIRRREQVRHQPLDVDAVRSGNDDEAGGVLVVGLVAQVLHHRQLLREHLLRDLLQHLRARDLVREGEHDDRAVLALETRAHPHAARSALVHRDEIFARGDDLGLGREVRAANVIAEIADGSLRLVEEPDAGGDDLAQVVRRNVRRHADRDSRRPVQQHVREAGREQLRLVERAVEVRAPLDGAFAQLSQQHLREPGELRLGVAHRRERLRIVGGPPVSLTVDQRIAGRERLREEHHRLVARALPVRVELAEHVADGARGLLVLRTGGQTQLRHRVDDAPLHRLQPVADMRQGAIEDHVHRVVEVRLLGELLQRAAFDVLEIE